MITVQTFLNDQRLYVPEGRDMRPLISVIFPLPQGGWRKEMENALRSVLAQSLKLFELIIVGDGNDASVEHAIRAYQRQDKRIIFAHHSSSSGLPALRINEGMLLRRVYIWPISLVE